MNSGENISAIRTCEYCNVTCSRKNDWDRHLLTAKHIKNSVLDGSAELQKTEYHCKKCDYLCNKRSLWEKHIYTKKHRQTDGNEKQEPNKYECKICNKLYDRYNSYWAHTKKCKPSEPDHVAIINKLILDNQELRSFLIEQSKNTNEIVNKALECCKPVTTNTTINGNVNNKFNLNVFLNEQCKDAINFADFVKNIEITYKDLENNAQLGFVNGISKIFLDNLKQLGINERPIHCTDVKRETMYIKDEDKWTKETDDAKLQQAIQTVSYRSMGKLAEWKQENPDYKDCNSDFSQKCLDIQKQTLAGSDRGVYYPKVIHALAREVVVDK
jgi:hypothetical protein